MAGLRAFAPQLLSPLTAPLGRHGFTRSGRSFRASKPGENSAIIEFQPTPDSTPDCVMFYVNLGVGNEHWQAWLTHVGLCRPGTRLTTGHCFWRDRVAPPTRLSTGSAWTLTPDAFDSGQRALASALADVAPKLQALLDMRSFLRTLTHDRQVLGSDLAGPDVVELVVGLSVLAQEELDLRLHRIRSLDPDRYPAARRFADWLAAYAATQR